MAAAILMKLFSDQTINNGFRKPKPTTWKTAGPFENDHHWRAPIFLRVIPDVLEQILFH